MDEMESADISVIIPVHNEEENILGVIREVKQVCPRSEILVVDDGSSDRTLALLSEAKGIVLIKHPYRKGNGAAVKTGIRNARGKVIVTMDGDGQHDPADIPSLVEEIGLYDMVVGARSSQSEVEFHRRIANILYNALASYLSGFAIKDLTSGFRAIRANIAKRFAYLLPNSFSYPSTITLALIKAGYSLKYVSILTKRRQGRSKIKILKDGLLFIIIMLKISTLFNPLKVFLPISLFLFLPGFFYGLYRIIILKSHITLPIVLSVSIGAIIFVLGLISEQIALLRLEKIDE